MNIKKLKNELASQDLNSVERAEKEEELKQQKLELR
jgi:hypothetical protein